MDCVQNVFARIVRKEEPADVVYEDDTVLAFKDKHPASSCHVLIVPKRGAVRNVHFLTVEHVELLEHMVSCTEPLPLFRKRSVEIWVLTGRHHATDLSQ